MDNFVRHTDLPVLVLHNIDASWEPDEIQAAEKEIGIIESSIKSEGHTVETVAIRGSDLEACLKPYDPSEHIILNWCESIPGIPRSEARVAEILEDHNFTYTGSPPDILRASWDKCNVKLLLEQHRIPTPLWKVFETPDARAWDLFPAIVKPACEHCSYGVTSEAVVMSREELSGRIRYVLETFQEPALVEDFIDGREFHVSLWGNGSVEMLPPAEMDYRTLDNLRDRLCTYDAKFRPGTRHYEQIDVLLPAPLSRAELEELQRVSRAAYMVMGCRDYARIDIRLRDGVFYVLDVNPNPDISSDTSMAAAAGLKGYSYGAMLSMLINFAALRHPVYGRR